jgi:16S rRNA (guanine527-N7)-methyltransferase
VERGPDAGGRPAPADGHDGFVDLVGLVDVLTEAQRLGFLGRRPIPEVIEHSRAFVAALAERWPVEASITVVDLGSGGGVPGLVIAGDLPAARVTLVDRREKRTDFLQRAVARLRLGDRVDVRCADVRALVAAGETFDAVTARGFGPPLSTLRLASQLVRSGGLIVISEPPAGERWPEPEVRSLGLERSRHGPVAVFRRI